MPNKVELRGIRNRKPLPKMEATQKIEKPSSFVKDLSNLSLDELKRNYQDIDGQSQMMKGLILLEARRRIPSDKDFGKWASTIGLSDSSSYQTRNTYMNLARFFEHRDMTGISITSAYEISKPSNADIAEDVYIEVFNKNLSVNETKRLIEQKKAITLITEVPPIITKKDSVTKEDEDRIFTIIKTLEFSSPNQAIALLRSCIKTIKSNPNVIQNTNNE